MAMNVGSGDDDDADVNSTINTTPLVDVMLVLLIIFLITVPVVVTSVPVDLPTATNIATQTKPENVVIAVAANGNVYWNDVLVPDSRALLEYLKRAAVIVPQPEVHIRADRDARFEFVGRVIVSCQRASILKVGFITEPEMIGAR